VVEKANCKDGLDCGLEDKAMRGYSSDTEHSHENSEGQKPGLAHYQRQCYEAGGLDKCTIQLARRASAAACLQTSPSLGFPSLLPITLQVVP